MNQLIYKRRQKKLTLMDNVNNDTPFELESVEALLKNLKIEKPLVVSRGGLMRSHLNLEFANITIVQFGEFTPNPTAEQVHAGLELYKKERCDCIISIGGGSAIDVAKAIQAIYHTDPHLSLLDRLTHPMPKELIHIAIPTTAGTGSESTHFATIYINQKKYSVADKLLIPKIAILDASLLATLPQYERSSTYLDAFCHSVESFWSVRSTKESQEFSRKALNLLVNNIDAYFKGGEEAAQAAILAANYAGRAINLTTTTAAHAMCYQLTSLYGLSHGHAAAVCLPVAWKYLLEKSEANGNLKNRLTELARIICQNESIDDPWEALNVFVEMFKKANFTSDWVPKNENDLEMLVSSVNLQRLSNFPIEMSAEDLRRLYRQALWKEMK